MSDRIDELEAAVRCDTSGYTADGDYFCHDSDAALDELATIARDNAREADKWRKVAYTAAGMLSTYPPYRGWHPERVLEYIESGIAAVEQEEAE